MEGYKLHDCAELPGFVNLANDTNCLDRIREVFTMENWMGGDALIMNMSIFVAPRAFAYILIKVGTIKENELRIACELNALVHETPIFPHTYGWLVCEEIPQKWREIMSVKLRRHPVAGIPLLFTFMQPVSRSWFEVPHMIEHRYRVCLFFLLHGLWVARTHFNFRHGDIHGGNIMMQRFEVGELVPTVVCYGDMEATVLSLYVPRLIDYSATEKYTPNRPGTTLNDLEMLRDTFDNRIKHDEEEFEGDVMIAERKALYRFLASPDWKTAIKNYEQENFLLLLANEYFDVPEIQRVKRRVEPISQRCFSCCIPRVNYSIQQVQPKYFCHENCYKKVHGICRFIK